MPRLERARSANEDGPHSCGRSISIRGHVPCRFTASRQGNFPGHLRQQILNPEGVRAQIPMKSVSRDSGPGGAARVWCQRFATFGCGGRICGRILSLQQSTFCTSCGVMKGVPPCTLASRGPARASASRSSRTVVKRLFKSSCACPARSVPCSPGALPDCWPSAPDPVPGSVSDGQVAGTRTPPVRHRSRCPGTTPVRARAPFLQEWSAVRRRQFIPSAAVAIPVRFDILQPCPEGTLHAHACGSR